MTTSKHWETHPRHVYLIVDLFLIDISIDKCFKGKLQRMCLICCILSINVHCIYLSTVMVLNVHRQNINSYKQGYMIYMSLYIPPFIVKALSLVLSTASIFLSTCAIAWEIYYVQVASRFFLMFAGIFVEAQKIPCQETPHCGAPKRQSWRTFPSNLTAVYGCLWYL